jgi:ankyrin repeat protein
MMLYMARKCLTPFFLLAVFVVSLAASEEAVNRFPPQAILIASYRGDVELMREILAENPDKNIRDAIGATALHMAILQPNLEAVKLLLDNGYDPNARATSNGFTPLHNAVAANNVEAARLLLQYDADKKIKSLEGLTPYDKAVKEEKRPLILLLYR